jgi:hypothetical protein
MSDISADSEMTPESRSNAGVATPAADRAIDGQDYALHSVVVRYDGSPDRCTIYPRRESCRNRMEAWISADHDVFVGLEENR